MAHHYNPDWLDDEALLTDFIARQSDFRFLRDDLARAPLVGNVQHYLLVGPRGAGKTTLLKRLAVAIRREDDLRDHLVALSFPEELYQVKNLSDFWWAACEALADELDRLGQREASDRLYLDVDGYRSPRPADAALPDGLGRLRQACAALARRPVLLVDNLDLVLERIDNQGRKRKDPLSPTYWELREMLSTTTSPVVIASSVRLSEPFTHYDKAFYDFFLPHRLGKLPLDEVRAVLERQAQRHGAPEVKTRLDERPARLETLYELTGGNPRAIGLIFELLRQGPNSRAVEDFERLMDLTTPYYKARFEDLSDQAQVIMHAMAVRRPGQDGGLRFGHTAAEIAAHAGLVTKTVSAQLDLLEKEGVIEKSAASGRTQYRIAEQLFRLWLQMRGSRRVRQNVIGLTEFLEAMFDVQELTAQLHGARGLAGARLAFAVAETREAAPLRDGLVAFGAGLVLDAVSAQGESLDAHLADGDLPPGLGSLVRLREQLGRCVSSGLMPQEEQEALLGSAIFSLAEKEAAGAALCVAATAQEEASRLCPLLTAERERLLRNGLLNTDLPLFFRLRAEGQLPLPWLKPDDAEAACCTHKAPDLHAMLWRLAGAREFVKFTTESAAHWLRWGREHAQAATSAEWANVAGTLRLSRQFAAAEQALAEAFRRGESSRAWFERGALLDNTNGEVHAAEVAYRKAIEIDPEDAYPWVNLGNLLANKLQRYEDAELAYRRAIEIDPNAAYPWNGLGTLYTNKPQRFEDAEVAYQRAIEIDPKFAIAWNNLGNLLTNQLQRYEEAEAAYRKALEIDPTYASPWNGLGFLFADKLQRYNDAEAAYREAIKINPTYTIPWTNLGNLFAHKLQRYEDAETAYRKATEINPTYRHNWQNLGLIFTDYLHRYEDAKAAYLKAIEIDPKDAYTWNALGFLLAVKLQRYEEAEAAFQKAIEIDPRDASSWSCLGNLLAEKPQHYKEAEAAYRKAIEIDPSFGIAWGNLGILLDQLQKNDAALEAYEKAVALDAENAAIWRNRRSALEIRLRLGSSRQALADGDLQAAKDSLAGILAQGDDVPAVLASPAFVQGLLGQALANPRHAAAMGEMLKELGLDKTARPLLLAYEAALENQEAALDALEPEVRLAAKLLYGQLIAGRDACIDAQKTERQKPHRAAGRARSKDAPSKSGGQYTAAFKARVALEAISGEDPLEALAKRHGLPAATIKQWKKQAQQGMLSALEDKKPDSQ